ncbi:beta/gamma crystallin domain-containing protein [Methylomonas methanica]|uniref:Calcium-dependent cell adhesion molecule N-terminal domain-containing protein n=1 Tax=Methylomonas methanica (strain DSM 25384 / MC09) TaxID=857087 RepID=G0A6X3_METMM|nr:beta/gamma crystallin domain-containing protein [Methylomonas methanica]AEG00594.1 hypothetical protein Metme_2190 [Methylomonas methanica MC09]
MNKIYTVFRVIETILLATILWSFTSVVYAKDKDCWVEFFQGSQYSGDHFRLDGPVQLANLRNVQGKNWELNIDSLKVGPSARVTVFENTNFKLTLKEMEKYPELLHSLGLTEKDAMEDKELIFGADSKIHDLSDFNFRKKIRSLKIDCE